MKTTRRTRTVQKNGNKRLLAHLDNDGGSTAYAVQVRISNKWTSVGNKMPADRPDCCGLSVAFAVYMRVSA